MYDGISLCHHRQTLSTHCTTRVHRDLLRYALARVHSFNFTTSQINVTVSIFESVPVALQRADLVPFPSRLPSPSPSPSLSQRTDSPTRLDLDLDADLGFGRLLQMTRSFSVSYVISPPLPLPIHAPITWCQYLPVFLPRHTDGMDTRPHPCPYVRTNLFARHNKVTACRRLLTHFVVATPRTAARRSTRCTCNGPLPLAFFKYLPRLKKRLPVYGGLVVEAYYHNMCVKPTTPRIQPDQFPTNMSLKIILKFFFFFSVLKDPGKTSPCSHLFTVAGSFIFDELYYFFLSCRRQ